MKAAQTDRIIGSMLGLAAGDALGAGYEFQRTVTEQPRMRGRGLGNWAPGEWTDDTQMAVCIAEVTATGSIDTTAIAAEFLKWLASGPADVGIQTSAVLGQSRAPEEVATAAANYYRRKPHASAGNGSLMRTAPVALACLGDDSAIAEAARAVSALTHGDPLAGDACVLWCVAIDRAVREGRLDGIRDGLSLLDPVSRNFWKERLDEAESRAPETFTPNGFVVTALQAAHAAIVQTPIPDYVPCSHLVLALERAVQIGHDIDTVAVIAGSLLGARWGASAVPFAWRRLLHGWPGYRASDLARLAVLTSSRGKPDGAGWPTVSSLVAHYGESPVAVPLDHDPGVLVGNLAGLAKSDVDAVVSLCRVGVEDVPVGIEHHELVLIDASNANPNLRFTMEDAADAVATLRDEGRRVLLHCAGGRSRTPTVAALFLMRRFGLTATDALQGVGRTLTEANPNPAFRALLRSYDNA